MIFSTVFNLYYSVILHVGLIISLSTALLPKHYVNDTFINLLWESLISLVRSIYNFGNRVDFYLYTLVYGTMYSLIGVLSKLRLKYFPNNDVVISEHIYANNNKIYFITPTKNHRTDTVIFYIHGGAWHYSSAIQTLSTCSQLATTCNMQVIVPDFRQAPTYKFPTDINDCKDAVNWHRKKYKKKIIIAGESSGGFVTIVLTKILLRENKKFIIGNVLLNPITSYNIALSRLTFMLNGLLPATRNFLRLHLFSYFGDDTLGKANNDYISLIDNDTSIKMPPTYIAIAFIDLLKDQQIQYFDRLFKQGIQTQHKIYYTFHGGFMVPNYKVNDTILLDINNFVKKHIIKTKRFI